MRTNHRVQVNKTTQKIEPKSIVVFANSLGTGTSSLTIAEGYVKTSGSLTLSLEELKDYIKQYEELP